MENNITAQSTALSFAAMNMETIAKRKASANFEASKLKIKFNNPSTSDETKMKLKQRAGLIKRYDEQTMGILISDPIKVKNEKDKAMDLDNNGEISFEEFTTYAGEEKGLKGVNLDLFKLSAQEAMTELTDAQIAELEELESGSDKKYDFDNLQNIIKNWQG